MRDWVKKAEMGVGTLIIFIALLLVAAVAAGVLIQTAGSLQEKALSTGTQAKSQISTNAVVIEISGTDGSNGDVDNFSMVMKLAPGSNPIKLDEATLTFNTKDTTTTYQFLTDADEANATNYCGNASTPASTAASCATVTGADGTFTVEYLQTGSNYDFGKLTRGDVLKVYFVSPRDVVEDEDVRINFIPKIGTSTLMQFSTPDVMSTERVYLYP